jgi:hypothetical protein
MGNRWTEKKQRKPIWKAKIAQARRLSVAITDPLTTDSLKAFIADLKIVSAVSGNKALNRAVSRPAFGRVSGE